MEEKFREAEGLRDAVSCIIENQMGEIVCVSRKNDHTDFGLVGGKIENNETHIEAVIRETREETGIILEKDMLKKVYEDFRYGRKQITYIYLEKLDNDTKFIYDEKHLVKWGSWKDVKNGSFGEYNTNLHNLLEYER